MKERGEGICPFHDISFLYTSKLNYSCSGENYSEGKMHTHREKSCGIESFSFPRYFLVVSDTIFFCYFPHDRRFVCFHITSVCFKLFIFFSIGSCCDESGEKKFASIAK